MNRNELMVWAWWGWEPLPFYLARKNAPGSGNASPEELREWYRLIHDEATLRRAAELGINCIVTHFLKGFGPEHEKEDVALTAKLVKNAHKYGISVWGYLQFGSLFSPSFYEEFPEAWEWTARDEKGEFLRWCNSRDRFMPCVNADGYFAYLKTCIRTGLLEIGLDGLHFDNFYSRPCFCPRCREAFRQVSGMELPGEAEAAVVPPSPAVLAWTRFRCEQLASRMTELKEYIRSIAPGAQTIWNPSPIRGVLDQRLLRGTDFCELGPRAGFLWAESGNFPGVSGGVPIHQVNFFKTAEATGCRTLSTVWKSGAEGHGLPETPAEVTLVTAEPALFGAVPGTNWLMRPRRLQRDFPDGPLARCWGDLIAFFKANDTLYSGTSGCGEISLFLDRSAAEKDFAKVYGMFLALQQLLLQKHFSFDLTFQNCGRPPRPGTLLLPVGAPPAGWTGPVLKFTDGELATEISGTYAASAGLPRNTEALVRRIGEALGPRELTCDAPDHVFMERRRKEDGSQILHLINYDNTRPVEKIRLTFRAFPARFRLFSCEKECVFECSGDTVVLNRLGTFATFVWEAPSC